MGKRLNEAKWLENQSRWQIKVQKDGVRRTFTCATPGRKGKKECHDKADAWLDDGIVDGGIRVSKLYDQWIEELKLSTGRGHWENYDSFGRNWIKKNIGHMRISAVNEQHLQDVVLAAFVAGLAKKTLQNIRNCLCAFIKYARKRKATTLFVENVSIPKNAPVGERTILQPADIVKLFNINTTTLRRKQEYDIYVPAYRFEVATGLRPGEVLGLRWSDIDDGIVSIRRSINKFGDTTHGKNENAVRSFALPPFALEILRSHTLKLKDMGISSDVIFCNENGDPPSQRTYHKRWTRYRTLHNLSSATPYELRHTFVSISKNMPSALLKRLVGHSEDMDTLGVYGHDVDGELAQAAGIVQGIFSGILDPNEASKTNVGL